MKTVKLTRLCSIKGGIPAPKKTTAMGNVPFVRMRELGDAHLSSSFSPGQEFLTETDEKTFTDKIIEPGAVLFPRSGSVHLNHRAHLESKAAIVSHIGALIPKQETDSLFLYHLLTDYNMTEIMTQTTGLNMIRFSQLNDVEFQIPDTLPEQTKIAEILSTVDRATEQTEALIAKQQRIKTGLMQDLLTRGIDEHGNLRSEQTHEFKDSPLGRIPMEWEVKRLDDLLVEKRYGISTSLSEEPIGTPVLRMNNLMKGEIDYSNLKYSTREDARKLTLNEGDILFNRTNSIDYVGRTGIYRNLDQRISFASYLVRLVTDSRRLHPEYLNLLLNDRSNQIRVKQFATIGVQQANVNPTNLGMLNIALPNDVTEQEKIIKAISTSRNCIYDIDANFRKLRSLKTALMQDLLTGKKRVTALLNDTEEISS